MSKLRITTIQADLVWESPAANRAAFTKKIQTLKGQTDLVILPEMFTTGFSMNPVTIFEEMNGETLAWMRAQAEQIDAVITGSIVIKENDKYYNRMLWVRPDGSLEYYDKKHLFTLADEHLHYEAGQKHLLVELKGWKICPLICYDLRFPVWSRNVENYDLLIYVASWPNKRALHWKRLLQARAIENQAVTIGVNRVGIDGAGFEYSGDTSVFDYAGKQCYQATEVEAVFTVEFDLEELKKYRSRFSFLADKDEFLIKN